MDPGHRHSARTMRARVRELRADPAAFRSALASVPAIDRDAWLDLVCGLDAIPDDGPELPTGCVPYLPCPVAELLQVVDRADIGRSDVFVDVGSGVGRAGVLVHLLTGASVIGLEIQRELVREARALAARLNVSRCAVVEGDAAGLAGRIAIGSVFFLYCPFGGARLDKLLDDLEPIARTRPIRVCSVDLPLPPRPWLTPTPSADNVQIHRSAQLDR